MTSLPHVDSPERGVILLGSDQTITYANRRAAQIFKMLMNELIGSKLNDIIQCQELESEVAVEEVLDGSLGDNRVFHRYHTPVYASDGQIAAKVEIYSDITARRELEKEILDRNLELARLNGALQEAQEQLVQAERLRALGEMAAGVAHDINNTLGIILGNAQLAKRKIDATSPAMVCVKAIELAAKDAADTVRRLREIGKPMDAVAYQTVDLSQVVQDVVSAALPAWRESSDAGEINIDVDTDLTANCLVDGNAIELREALANILLNAAQSIESSGKIFITTRINDEHAELIVRDNGVGMTEETRQRLFDPFFTTRGAEGTGLGMSMVDAMAIRHRGKVLVDSVRGKGTTITLRFPSRK